MRIGLVSGLLAIAISMVAQNSRQPTAASADSFEAPLKKTIVDFGPSPYYRNPKTAPRVKLSCFYFPTFMVKEYDEGEKGAEWMAIVPRSTGNSDRCTRSHVSSERLIGGKDWSGYFKGVKRNFVFFDASDGT